MNHELYEGLTVLLSFLLIFGLSMLFLGLAVYSALLLGGIHG